MFRFGNIESGALSIACNHPCIIILPYGSIVSDRVAPRRRQVIAPVSPGIAYADFSLHRIGSLPCIDG